MTFFSKPVIFTDDTDGNYYYSSGDVARVDSDVALAAWSYGDETFYLQAARYSTRTAGPQLRLAEAGPIYALAESDDGVWMLAGFWNESQLRLGKVEVSDALVVSVTWKAHIDVDWFYGAWLHVWGDRLIVGSNCGNVNDPNDPDGRLDSQFYMFDMAGNLLDKESGVTYSYVSGGTTYTYTEWIDTVALNPYTDELMMMWDSYTSGIGYREKIATMSLSGSSFGSWVDRGELYPDHALWVTAVGTPGGWHVLSCPNGPRYAEIIVLDHDLNRRWTQTMGRQYYISTWNDEEQSKPYDIAYDPTTETVNYSALEWYEGLLYAQSGVDADQWITVDHVPRTDAVDYEGLMRVATLGDGKNVYFGGAAGGLVRPRAGGSAAYWHALWLMSEVEGGFPTPFEGQSAGRSNFRRPR